MNPSELIVSLDLLPAQREFFSAPAWASLDICIYQGGFGSGKTWAGSLLGLLLCEKNPGSLGLVVAKTFTLLRETTFRQYKDHLFDLGFREGVDFKIYRNEGRIVLPCFGGAEILFKHMETPDAVRSITAAWVQMEECSMLSEADFNELLGRARQKIPGRNRIFGHTNPQPSKGWIYKHFVERDSTSKDQGISYRRIIAPTTENIHNPPHFVDSMKNQFNEEYYNVYVLGLDGDYKSGLVCEKWSVANVDNDTNYEPDLPIYLTCDFNVDPMCWALAHRVNGEYHFFDELAISNVNTQTAAEQIALKYGKHKAGIIITGDASGQMRRTEGSMTANDNSNDSQRFGIATNYKIITKVFTDYGMQNFATDLPPKNPNIQDRVIGFKMAICNHQDKRLIKVNAKKCPKIIYNMENLKYIPGTSTIQTPTLSELNHVPDSRFLGHMFDAVSYLVARYNPLRREVETRKRPSVGISFSKGW